MPRKMPARKKTGKHASPSKRTAPLPGAASKIDVLKTIFAGSDEPYRTLLESAPDPIVIYDPNWRIVYVNAAFSRTFGWEMEELLGKPPVFVPDDEATAGRIMEAQARSDGRFPAVEARRRTKGGDEVYVEISGTAYAGRDRRPGGCIAVYRDRSRRRQLEQQLFNAQKMEAVATLAGGIAHDFNNILQAIVLNTELAAVEYASGINAAARLDEVMLAVERSRSLVKQILTFSRQGEQPLSPIEIGAFVKEAIKMLRASLPATVAIQSHISEQTGLVLSEPAQIRQILLNLCTNAHHAMKEEGGGTLTIELFSAAAPPPHIEGTLEPAGGRYAVLKVSDTGCGMDRTTVERIFEPYYSTKPPGQGTGLGLAVVHGFVSGMGGTVAVESEPGRGSAFSVWLPVVEPNGLKPKLDLIQEIPNGSERILLVDDEKGLVSSLEAGLRRLGYRIRAHSDSRAALADFQKNTDKIDMVITDQTMPNLTGAALAKKILTVRPDMPIILCTGFSEAISEAEAKKIGIGKFVMKPVVIRELAATIRKLLDDGSGGKNGPAA